jgi:diguanylate cyclase (GGDEF)-like protein/PAS domain S-box-containing protein
MRRWRVARLSLQMRVMLLAGFAVGLVLLADAAARQFGMERDGLRSLEERAALLVSIQGNALSVPMWNLDEDQVGAVLAALAEDRDFVSACVLRPDGTVLARRTAPGQTPGVHDPSMVAVKHDITYLSHGSARQLGTLRLWLSTTRLERALRAEWWDRALAVVMLLAAVMLAVYGALRQFTRPLDMMATALTRLAAGDRDTPIPASDRDDEVGAVARALQVFRDTAFRLVKAEGTYRAVFENAGLGIYAADEKGHVHSVNAALVRICGYPDQEALLAALANRHLGGVYADPGRSAELRRLMREHRAYSDEISEIIRGDGSRGWISHTARPVHDDAGRILGFAGTVEDVTDRLRRQGEEQLRVRAAMESASDAILIVDNAGAPLFANPAFTQCFGSTEGQPSGADFLRGKLTEPAAAAALADALRQGLPWRGEAQVRTSKGHLLPMLIRASAIRDAQGANFGAVVISTDLSDRRRAEARIRHMAHHDWLTGLPNRVLFRERLDEALAMTIRDGLAFAVLCIDLDRFKAVNDTLGHVAGDGLLQLVAIRLQQVVRERDTVARVGGDEFMLIQVGIENPGQVVALAERLIRDIERPFDLGGRDVQIGASVGIVLAPEHGTDPDTLLGFGDVALYEAKSQGRSQARLFTTDMDRSRRKRAELERDLRHAVTRQELELYFQPQFDLATGRLIGAEALSRWTDRVRGPVPPDEFIPMAEECGLIGMLGRWVLLAACREASAWPAHVRVAVNVSPVQFKTGDLIDSVRRALAETGLAPHRLDLEITEGVFMQDSDTIRTALTSLKSLGVRITLDDFGTGYSSLSYLRRMPFDKIKVDRSFVAALGQDPAALALVRSIIGLAKVLGLESNAEGVETGAQAQVLREEGCQEVQGYYFGRPMPARDFAAQDAMRPAAPLLVGTA